MERRVCFVCQNYGHPVGCSNYSVCKNCFPQIVKGDLNEQQWDEIPHCVGGPPEKCCLCEKKFTCYNLNLCSKHKPVKKQLYVILMREREDIMHFIIMEGTNELNAFQNLIRKAANSKNEDYYVNAMLMCQEILGDHAPEGLSDDVSEYSERLKVKKHLKPLLKVIEIIFKDDDRIRNSRMEIHPYKIGEFCS